MPKDITNHSLWDDFNRFLYVIFFSLFVILGTSLWWHNIFNIYFFFPSDCKFLHCFCGSSFDFLIQWIVMMPSSECFIKMVAPVVLYDMPSKFDLDIVGRTIVFVTVHNIAFYATSSISYLLEVIQSQQVITINI